MLDERQIEMFRERLLHQQQELLVLKQTGEDAVKTVELDQTSVGRLSRMDALQGQAMSRERERRRHIELQKIAAALRRIEQGDYGYCARCGEEIAVKRLELDPAVALCIACASQSDASDRT
ncbi:TraR/DksA family transcriptional regulator [Thiogranum longum]